MKINDIEIDYGDLIFSKRYEIDQQSYSMYYNEYYNNKDYKLYSYNGFYGTELHKKYANIILRRNKLEKINKLNGEER